MKHPYHWRLSTVISVVILNLLLLWGIQKMLRFDFIPRQQSSNSESTRMSAAGKNKPLLLYWGNTYEDAGLNIECSVTYDQSRLPDADAVIFHFDKIRKRDMPWKNYRDKHQIFIWWCAEAPAIFGRNALREFDGFFNWTWTYKRDADVQRLYGSRREILNFVTKGNQAVDKIISHKKKMALWGVSHCGGSVGANKRMEYFKSLVAAGLDIKRFGGCFHFTEHIPRSFPANFEPRWREYKFYFAFENALHCTDYITEKFWDNALRNDMVPVVWGPTKDDVLSVAPLDSFIHTDDFDSPAKLAEYLQFLDKNDDEYRKYFRWREDESMTDEKMIEMTKERHPHIHVQGSSKDLCRKLIENKETKIIHSLTDEFINSEPQECVV
uniref:alpha-(1,3)-fucosyltransferase 6-like n=1 Tax=Ciona intestinalis TaxID=7719 RepID=UPI000180B1C6|nr:alpha-(1,3)-fucosyltransferase 6-like [Ciona intestinalis]|eukprot:XP_002125006.1 alpha-(1,3)-fucosyltransferase 6-like [Ciona intestinalis]